MKKKSVKDVLGCDKQPLWQRVLVKTTIYLIEIIVMLLKLFLIFIFWGTLIDIKGYRTDLFTKLIIFCCLIGTTVSIECLSDKVSAEIILFLFILSYWITYGVLLRYNYFI